MEEINLTKEEFKLFDQDDQVGFFYDEDGYPKPDAEDTFESDVDALYQQYDYISVDFEDNIYGVKSGKKALIMENVIEAFDIALEIRDGL